MDKEKSKSEVESEDTSSSSFENLGSGYSEEMSLPSLGYSPMSGNLVRYDPLKSYLSEIKHIPKLSREEEKELAVRFREKGDQVAGYKLVLANLRLVVIIVKEYQKNLSNILDLVQEGNLGLMEAVKQFDPYKGVRFSSYASYWIRAYVLRYIINNIRLVKIGTTQAQRKLFYNLQKEQSKLEAEGFHPEAKLLAKRLDVKESEVIEMQQRMALPDLSVDSPIGEGTSDYHSVIPDESSSVESKVSTKLIQERINKVVDEYKNDADEKEIAIIDRRLFTDEPETLSSIAKDFGLSRERMRQIESTLKEKLKIKLEGSFKGELSEWSLE